MLGPMNRQLRRAQAKQDSKADREKERKKRARKEKLDAIRERRKERRLSGAKPEPKEPLDPAALTPEQRRKLPGRFSGALMVATVFFIILQAAVPVEDANVTSSLVGAGFFLMFGYFSTLFLYRRGNDKAYGLTITSGLALAVGVLATRLIGPERGGLDGLFLLMVGLGAAGIVLGAFLGRAVFNAGLRQ